MTPRAGRQNLHHSVVAALQDRQRRDRQQRRKIGPCAFRHHTVRRLGNKRGELGLGQRMAGQQAPPRQGQPCIRTRRDRGAERLFAHRAAAGRDNNVADALPVTPPARLLVDDVARVAQLVRDAMRRGEGFIERDQCRIAVDQDQIIVALNQIEHLGDALGHRRLDQNIADGTHDAAPPRRAKRRIEHRQNLEPKLTPPK